MSILEDALARVAAVLHEINHLKQSEFPYVHPRSTLNLLEERFTRHQSVLEKASANTQIAVLHNACRDSLREISVYLPILGFVLRATNVRNAFEVYGPLQRLAHILLGADTKLIVSSEWEFSPFVYRAITGLREFVLIGLPAPESSNPLLLPLAGHELGHFIWNHESFSSKYEKQIEKGILKELIDNRWSEYSSLYPQHSKKDVEDVGHLFTSRTWRPAYTWALFQIEEMFCDFFGLRLFAESFLYAFAYLLSPGRSGERSLRYPDIKHRVSYLVQAAQEMEIDVPEDYELSFGEESEPAEPTTALLVSLADVVSTSLAKELIELARDFANKKDAPKKDPDKVEEISKSFGKLVVPIRKSASLVDIVNSGWKCNMDEHLWENVPQIKSGNRYRVLRDIMLKSMEITEIYERLGKIS
ncbi:MAG: hypothetical protein QME42_05095 [bacterium]|nr:hypothetical protein [bacterium]